jgi:hypothetical protein
MRAANIGATTSHAARFTAGRFAASAFAGEDTRTLAIPKTGSGNYCTRPAERR